MCFGVVRYTHLQRSYLVGGNGGILVFWCTKGKTGSRGGFAWSVPRYCGTLDLLQVLGNHLNKVRPHSGDGTGWASILLLPNLWGRPSSSVFCAHT